MRQHLCLALLCAGGLLASCGGGSTGGGGDFQLIEFLDSGKNSLPRNRELVFRFSAPVLPGQDFSERLKITNVQAGGGQSDFSRAIGVYLVNAEAIVFCPRLPQAPDRSDAGFRANGNYHVFLKAGPDALASSTGDQIASQQEFLFDTSEYFEDPEPLEPPRALQLFARDSTDGSFVDLSREDSSPSQLALLDSSELIAAGRVVDPGAGGAPDYATPWQFELHVSEPLDPFTVTTSNVELLEIRTDALTGAESATPGHFGNSVAFRVPILVEMIQRLGAAGDPEYFIRVTVVQTLEDDARYRLIFSGDILGIDFRKVFLGDNGLTGDGLAGSEPGGSGYVTEFLVYDRPAITATRTVTYDPLADGVEPETGNTTNNEALYNSALYNPTSNPGSAVGFLSDFGDGSDGPLAVSGGNVMEVDTGDTTNQFVGNPFSVIDLNPGNDYLADTRPGSAVTYDTPEPFELQLESLVVSSSSTLRLIGVNPILLRVKGVVEIAGIVDVAGGDGFAGGGGVANAGVGGPGGFSGGSAQQGITQCTTTWGSCTPFATFLSTCQDAQNVWPISRNGEGPGRGHAGGSVYSYDYQDDRQYIGGTGGGGGSHASAGTVGEDRRNATAADGSFGNTCGSISRVYNSGIVGLRGQPGATYGDREIADILLGGSGGAAGGGCYGWGNVTKRQAGGSGGGGGGSISIYASGPILATGGRIDASGGDGGDGALAIYNQANGWISVSGGGGGGAGGSITLISGDALSLAGARLDASGGQGGARAQSGTTCASCNAGGGGGKGFIFLMDADGNADGLLPGVPGEYDTYPDGVLTISKFETSRFSSISAVTELFGMPAANPEYMPLDMADVIGVVSDGQKVHVYASSAKGDVDLPLQPDPSTEIPGFEVATIEHIAGSITVNVYGNMDGLNPGGPPARDAFVRLRAVFEYGNGVEAALGPFATIDEVTITCRFNG